MRLVIADLFIQSIVEKGSVYRAIMLSYWVNFFISVLHCDLLNVALVIDEPNIVDNDVRHDRVLLLLRDLLDANVII